MPTFPGATTIGSSLDGGQLTVSAILRQPTFVQAYLLELANQLFIAEKLYRKVQNCPSGSVVYHTSVPLFVDGQSSLLQEREEIPATVGDYGTPQTARSQRRGLAVEVTEQMQTRNDINALAIQLMQVRNTLVRDFDGGWMTGIANAVATSHKAAAAALWASTGTDTVRSDVANAARSITAEKRGFTPDTIVIDQTTAYEILGNPNIWQIFRGVAANLNPQLAGFDPNSGRFGVGYAGQLLGLDVWVTMDGNIPTGAVYVMQRRVFGGLSDERPLRAIPWYPHKAKEVWRSDVTRVTAFFIDQPLALAEITGVR